MVKYGTRMFEMVPKGKKWSQNFQYGLKWPTMVSNVSKWAKKIGYKFNRMAFLTRFNLVLVLSKIVKKKLLKSHLKGSGYKIKLLFI